MLNKIKLKYLLILLPCIGQESYATHFYDVLIADHLKYEFIKSKYIPSTISMISNKIKSLELKVREGKEEIKNIQRKIKELEKYEKNAIEKMTHEISFNFRELEEFQRNESLKFHEEIALQKKQEDKSTEELSIVAQNVILYMQETTSEIKSTFEKNILLGFNAAIEIKMIEFEIEEKKCIERQKDIKNTIDELKNLIRYAFDGFQKAESIEELGRIEKSIQNSPLLQF